jgi:hypothetical protein
MKARLAARVPLQQQAAQAAGLVAVRLLLAVARFPDLGHWRGHSMQGVCRGPPRWHKRPLRERGHPP